MKVAVLIALIGLAAAKHSGKGKHADKDDSKPCKKGQIDTDGDGNCSDGDGESDSDSGSDSDGKGKDKDGESSDDEWGMGMMGMGKRKRGTLKAGEQCHSDVADMGCIKGLRCGKVSFDKPDHHMNPDKDGKRLLADAMTDDRKDPSAAKKAASAAIKKM